MPIENDPENATLTIGGEYPALRLTGTESAAGDLSLREDEGELTVYDESLERTVFHFAPFDVVDLTQEIRSVDISATGTVATSQSYHYLYDALLASSNGVFLEVALEEPGAADVDIELYNETDGQLVYAETVTNQTRRTRSPDLLDSANVTNDLTANRQYSARATVTTADTGTINWWAARLLYL